MSEFVDTMKKWQRMCNFYDETYKDKSCENCPLHGENCGAVWEIDVDRVDEIEEIVNAWNESALPTWGEWFESRGDLISGWSNATSEAWLYDKFRIVMDKPIPADIAEKLGLEPKDE